MRSEIADMPEVEVLDRRIGAVGQQRRPVIIGADLHPPLVDANGDRGVDSAIVLAVAARKQAAHAVHHLSRSEERRVGKGCVSTCRSRWSPYQYKKKNKRIIIVT